MPSFSAPTDLLTSRPTNVFASPAASSTSPTSTSPTSTTSSSTPIPFWEFYETHFLREHRHPANVALHVLGTLASVAYIPLAGRWLLERCTPAGLSATVGARGLPWWAAAAGLVALYPLVHAGPGLLGHYLFEPNAAVGNLRVLRKDFPGLYFLLGNHVMALNILTLRHRFS